VWVQRIIIAVALLCDFRAAAGAQTFDCSDVYCTKLTSCAEAYYKLLVCNQSVRDNDNDSIPCENLCTNSSDTAKQRMIAGWPKGLALPQTLLAVPNPDGNKEGLGIVPDAFADPQRQGQPFTCAVRKSKCNDMISCDEAKFYLNSCGMARLDGDGDGRPCNALCR
jgi:Excalibur calcium-binding domain